MANRNCPWNNIFSRHALGRPEQLALPSFEYLDTVGRPSLSCICWLRIPAMADQERKVRGSISSSSTSAGSRSISCSRFDQHSISVACRDCTLYAHRRFFRYRKRDSSFRRKAISGANQRTRLWATYQTALYHTSRQAVYHCILDRNEVSIFTYLTSEWPVKPFGSQCFYLLDL